MAKHSAPTKDSQKEFLTIGLLGAIFAGLAFSIWFLKKQQSRQAA